MQMRAMTVSTRAWAIMAVAAIMAAVVGGISTHPAHAAPQAGVDPTGSNVAIWGSPSFNRQIGPNDVVVQVAGEYGFTVSLLSDGSVACWGNNGSGQCDVPSGIGTPQNPVASVAAGGGHTVAVLTDGSVACWGSNDGGPTDYGQSDVPSGIGTPQNPVASVAAGGSHTVAVLTDGSLACWGLNNDGRCDVPSGIGTPQNPVASVAAGGHTVAVLADGSVACWGRNDYGQCDVPSGIGTPQNPVASVAAGYGHTVAVLSDGSVACWGRNNYGECDVPSGIGTPQNPVASVAAGAGHTVAVMTDGSLACWGLNNEGQCDVPSGIGTPGNPVASVAAGDYHTVAVLSDGSVACWGWNDYGQCDVPSGIGTPENPVASVAAGDDHTVAVLSDGSVACWGRNDIGQCDVPSGIGTPQNPVASVAAGYVHTVAVLSDGSVACWGWNDDGQCDVPSGIGTPENPVVSIAAGGNITVVATAPAMADCNNNGQEDTEEILEGLADDCNGNWIPDECEYGARSMDLVFAIDVSGSMNDDIGFLIDELGTLSGLIGTDDRVGIIEFINDANVRFPMSSDVGAFESSFIGMPTTGGGGSPEASDIAVKFAAGASVSCATGDLGGLRPEADKILVLFTDEEAGGCYEGSNPQGALEAAQAAAQAGIKVIAIAERSAPIAQMQQYATLTGGALLIGASGDLAERIAVAIQGLRNGIDPTGDCNGNGIFDACELANGTATDCNGDGFLDECQLGGRTVSVGPFTTPVNGASTSVFMPATQPARTTVTLEITANADLNSTSEYFSIQIGSYAFDFSTGIQCGTGSASIAVPQAAWNEALGPEGVEVLVTSTAEVGDFCLNQMTISGLVEGLPDLNRNGIPDQCEGLLVFDVPSVFPTIAEAVATAPDDAWVQLAPGTYGEAVDFSGKAIVIVGDPADPASVVLDGTGLDTSVVTADSGETAASVLRGVTVRGGMSGTPLPGDPATLAGGGLYAWETDITVEDCVFRANRSALGGAVFARAGAVTFTRCVFDDNDASSYGGGVNLSRCFGALIDDCVFIANFTNASGGGLHAFGGDPTIMNCLFESNQALQPGGGVSWDAGNQGPLLIGQSEIRLNDSATAGGGLATLFSTTPPILVADSIVCDNLPDQVFGGFGDLGGACVLEVCDADGDGIGDCIDTELSVPGDYATITEAIAAASDGYTILVAPGVYPEIVDPQGKAIAIVGETGLLPVVIDGEDTRRTVIVARNETSQTRFENLVFTNGVNSFEIDIDGNGVIDWWDSNGGGGFIYESSPTFVGCRFDSNDCTRSGGGIYIYGASAAPIFSGCTFEANTAVRSGGGISSYQAATSLSECDLISNVSESLTFGGGACAVTGEFASVVFAGGVLEGNRATGSRGGAISTGSGATLVLSEVVVTGNESFTGSAIDGETTSPLFLSKSRVCGNIGEQVSGRVEDDGTNCISEVCDSDSDGTYDCDDACPDDPDKIDPGACGCGVADTDSDADGTADCLDGCPADPYKIDPGVCGCGVSDQDSDGDGTPDCIDDEIHVPSQFSTIADAVAAAGDGVTIFLAPGTYQEAVDFQGKAITIEGDPANPGSVVLSGGGPSGVPSSMVIFQSGEGAESILRGVTIRDGRSGTSLPGDPSTRAGGALFGWESSPTIEDCIIDSNAAPLGGGAFFRAGAVVLRRCEFRSNEASSYGGGLNLSRCFGAVIEDCRFVDNFTNTSGAGCHVFGGAPTFVRCDFESNQSLQPGGAVSWDSAGQGPLLLDECVVQFNQSASEGGGIATLFGTLPGIEIRSSTVCDNDPDNIFGIYQDLGGNTLCVCPADLSGNGVVDGPDLGLWLAFAGKSCVPGESCPGDLDGDGEITGGDLGVLLSAWGACP